jgi:hypothetical protein
MTTIRKNTLMKNLVVTTMNEGKYVSGKICGLEYVDKKPSKYLVKYHNMTVAYDIETFKKIMAGMLDLLKVMLAEQGVKYLVSVYTDEFGTDFDELMLSIGRCYTMFDTYNYTSAWPISLNMDESHCLQITTKYMQLQEAQPFIEPPHDFIRKFGRDGNTVFVDPQSAPVQIFFTDKRIYSHKQQHDLAHLPTPMSTISGEMRMLSQESPLGEPIECEQRVDERQVEPNVPKRKGRPCKRKRAQAQRPKRCTPESEADTEEETAPVRPTFCAQIDPYVDAFIENFIDKAQFEKAVYGFLGTMYDRRCLELNLPVKRLATFTEYMDPKDAAWTDVFLVFKSTLRAFIARCSDESYIPATIVMIDVSIEKNHARPSLKFLMTKLDPPVVARFVAELHIRFDAAKLGLVGTPLQQIITAKELLKGGIIVDDCYKTFVENTTASLEGSVVERLSTCKELLEASLIEKPLYDGLVKKWLPFCF